MAKKKNNKKILVDDKEYWKNRHAQTPNLKASGVKSVGVKSNEYIYKILAEQYINLLHSIDLRGVKTVLDCGFGDGYFLRFYTEYFPKFEIFGVDISPDAKKKIDFINNRNLYVSDLAKFKSNRRFDIVHSFDVLYHVLQDEDYVNSLSNMATLSKRYVILHERFLKRPPLVSSNHVRLRSTEFTNQILNAHGFFVIKEIPTHFVASRLLTYKLNKIMPRVLYKIDRYIADSFHPSSQDFLASHYIRVYSKSN